MVKGLGFGVLGVKGAPQNRGLARTLVRSM